MNGATGFTSAGHCEEVPCSYDPGFALNEATARGYEAAQQKSSVQFGTANNAMIASSTSFDLIDLRRNPRWDRYTNYNPGYKCVSPPEDVKVEYPSSRKQSMSRTAPDLSHIPVNNSNSNGSKDKPDLLRSFRVASSTSASRLEELFYRGVSAKSKSVRTSWNGSSQIPSPPPPPYVHQGRKLSSPFSNGCSPPKSQSPTPPFATPPCSPLAFEQPGIIKPPDVRPKLRQPSSKSNSPSSSMSSNSISPRDSWHSDTTCDSGRSTPLYWELEMPHPIPSPIRCVDPDLKTTPIKTVSSNSSNNKREKKPRKSTHGGQDSGTLKSGNSSSRSSTPRSSERNHPPNSPRLALRSSSVSLNSNTSNNNNSSSRAHSSSSKHTNKVQVWIPQQHHQQYTTNNNSKPKVKPKPKKDKMVDSRAVVHHSSNTAHVCNTLPRSNCGGNSQSGGTGCSVHNPSSPSSTTSSSTASSSKTVKSQSCHHISASSGASGCNSSASSVSNTTNNHHGCSSSSSFSGSGNNSRHLEGKNNSLSSSSHSYKGRSQTPPRVLSPSLQQMSCEVIADI